MIKIKAITILFFVLLLSACTTYLKEVIDPETGKLVSREQITAFFQGYHTAYVKNGEKVATYSSNSVREPSDITMKGDDISITAGDPEIVKTLANTLNTILPFIRPEL